MHKIEKFPRMESVIDYRSTNIGAALAWICVLIIAGLAAFPLHELSSYGSKDYFIDKPDKFAALIIMDVLCLTGSFVIGRYLINAKENNRFSIVVNERGAFIFFPDGKLSEQFLYSELSSSNENHMYDITLLFNIKYNTTRLVVYKKDNSNNSLKSIMSFQWSYYAIKNRFELYRHFLLGVQTFRPDLRIQYNTLLHFQLIEKQN